MLAGVWVSNAARARVAPASPASPAAAALHSRGPGTELWHSLLQGLGQDSDFARLRSHRWISAAEVGHIANCKLRGCQPPVLAICGMASSFWDLRLWRRK